MKHQNQLPATSYQLPATSLKPILKPVFNLLFFGMLSYSGYAQTNTLPPSGNVGIGTTTPSSALQVNGTARIDSSLIVKDSIVINKTARVKSDLKVDGNAVFKSDATVKNDFKVLGQSNLIGNVVVKEGDLKVKTLGDTSLPGKGVVLVNANGKLSNGGNIKSLVYEDDYTSPMPCLADPNTGNIIYQNPTWQHDAQRMFVLNNNCLPDVKVGIGVKPTAKLHIVENNIGTTHPILVEKAMPGGQAPYKLLELDYKGLLYAREIKVNLDSWPDYVFEKEYQLQTLQEIEQYINTHKHLPNIPSAKEVETDGLKLGEMNKLLLQKIEELTLHLIEQDKRIKELETQINKP